MSAGEESGESSDEDIAHAKTQTPVAGVPVVAATHTIPSEEAALGARPESDEVARRVARARIANKLFATENRVRLGRYHLLETVGSGGMGVVWGAWDPELDRRVAIKLVKAAMQAARDRILGEGQSLAKLSHPNVVPVYDVGVVDEQVYLVMEWVRGQNLRAYCKEPRTIREILTVYRAAGDGLSAAHRAGLIHRDFKPDNAMIGDDGRVRVLDFGLARVEVKPSDNNPSGDSITRGAGTPRYMPPEQFTGEAMTPAVDQFAFCVSLREALVGRNADGKDAVVPGWIDEILIRGGSDEASRRFASMDELLRALSRDPATIWRRRIAVAGALGLVGVAFAVGSARSSGGEVELCAGGPAEIGKAWNPTTRSAMAAHLQTLGKYGVEESSRLANAFDDYRDRWSAAYRDACLAQSHGELTAVLYERNLGCLSRARTALVTIVELISRADADQLTNAVGAALSLPSSELCLVEARDSTVDPPPLAIATRVRELRDEVERANVLARAIEPNAIDAAAAVVEKAKPLGYLPLTARAHLVHGVALVHRERDVPAVEALGRAYSLAFEARDDVTAIEAYAQLINEIARTDASALPAKTADQLGAIPIAEAIAKRLGPAGGYARSLLYNNIGTVRLTAGDRDSARAWFVRARDEWERSGRHPDLTVIWTNLGIVADARAERDALAKRARDELERALGPYHPSVLDARVSAAMLIGNPQQSIVELREPCRQFRDVHPKLRERSTCSFELGWLAEESGDIAEARTAMTEVEQNEMSEEKPIAEGYLMLFAGSYSTAAERMHAHADELLGRTHPFSQFRAVDALIVGAAAEVRLANNVRATATLRKALSVLEQLPFGTNEPYQRRLARVRATLASLIHVSDPPRARELSANAIRWYEEVGGYDRMVTNLKALR